MKEWKLCGAVQANYGCPVGHVCMGIRISVFAPLLCNISVSGLDEYADGCPFVKGADWYPFCLGRGNGWGSGGWVVPRGSPGQNLRVTSTSFFCPPE